MEVLIVIIMVIIYFLLDRTENQSDSNSYDYLEQK
jgi:preprotein translocase subunit YajC